MTYKGKRGCFQWHTHTHTHTHFFLSSCYLEFFVYLHFLEIYLYFFMSPEQSNPKTHWKKYDQ